MPREIRRKIIDNDLEPSGSPDDFEKELESQLAADFETASGRSDMGLMMPDEEGDNSGPDLFDFAERQDTPERAESSHGFSLDAFEPAIEEPQEDEPPQKETIAVKPAPPKGMALKKVFMIGVPCLLALVLLSVVAIKVLHKEPAATPPKRVVTQVRKQIVVPHYQEKADFFLVATAQEGKSVVSLSIELEFHSEERHQSYQVENILFRDLVLPFSRGATSSQKHFERLAEHRPKGSDGTSSNGATGFSCRFDAHQPPRETMRDASIVHGIS